MIKNKKVIIKRNHLVTDDSLYDQKAFQKVKIVFNHPLVLNFLKKVSVRDLFRDRIAYHISLVNVQTNYCNNNLLILDEKQIRS